MSRLLSFIIFITIASLVYFGLHFFVYKCLTRSLVQIPSWQKTLKWFFLISGLSFFISMTLNHLANIHFTVLYFYAVTWLGVIAISFFIFLLQLIVSKIFPSQTHISAIIALCVIGVIVLYSLYNGLQVPRVKKLVFPIKQLPQKLSGFSIVQLSDVHLESYQSEARIKYIVDQIIALKPDLLVITGDLIDGDICTREQLCNHFKRLKIPYGILAITGNHEFYSGIDNFMSLAKRTNMKTLRNEVITIADSIQVIGVDDYTAKQFGFNGPDLKNIVQSCDPKKPIILLNHRPQGFDEAVKLGVDLQLSGHTHAGQIPPMELVVWLYYKYPFGIYEKDGSYIYTSCGTGMWGPPMRFLSKNEILHITLKSK